MRCAATPVVARSYYDATTLNKPLNILMQNRPDSRSHPGGDTVQMQHTTQFLRDLGHRVDHSLDPAPNLREYDVVHLFNLTRPVETLAQCRNAIEQRRPYVLSSVYWDLDSVVPWSAHEWPRSVVHRLTPKAVRGLRRRMRRDGPADRHAMQAEIVRNAALVFPNSHAEKDHLLERFPGLSTDQIIVVLNGIDPVCSADALTPFSESIGALVCAGAIGPRKNQLNLVRAFQQLPDLCLVIVGDAAPGCSGYLNAAKRASRKLGNVSFRARLPSEYMHGVFRQARAVVQPSYIETPGLAAMEAAAMGVPIVVADVPPVREYFTDIGHYCDPNAPDSIAQACRMAAAAGRSDGSRFTEQYAWRNVLKPLKQAYERIATDRLNVGSPEV